MNRTRAVNRCPDCNEVLKEKDGMVTCACERRPWQVVRAEKGTEAEEKYLSDNGFHFARDVNEDVYYVGPLGHIIHLYSDNEWDSDKAPADCSLLDEYLTWLAKKFGPAVSTGKG